MRASLKKFPEHNVGEEEGTITLLDPCDDPFYMIPGPSTDIDTDYTEPAVYTFPTLSVSPPECKDFTTFELEYESGPYDGALDLTSLSQEGASSSFDPETGSFVFDTSDTDTFPAGEYNFVASAIIGDKKIPVPFRMTVLEYCEMGMLFVQTKPEENYMHVLRDPEEALFTYDLATVVGSTGSVDCGVPEISFMLEDGSVLPDLFTDDRSVEGEYKLSAGYSEAVEFASEHSVKFRFNYSHRPSRFIDSKTFTVLIIDKCNPPVWFEPQPTLSKAAPITSEALINEKQTIDIKSEFVTEPPYCIDYIDFDVGQTDFVDGTEGMQESVNVNEDGTIDVMFGEDKTTKPIAAPGGLPLMGGNGSINIKPQGGFPLFGPGGQPMPLYAPNGQPIYGPENGDPLYGPDGEQLVDAEGNPVYGPAGIPLFGPGGESIFGPGGVPLFGPGGVPLITEDGEPIYGPENGVPILDENGEQMMGPGGFPLFGPGAHFKPII